MKLEAIDETTFASDESILAATLKSADEWIMFLSNGVVGDYKTGVGKVTYLFSVDQSINYTDGGFDLKSPCSLYTLDDIVVLVNDYKTHYATHSKFPIALFKDEN